MATKQRSKAGPKGTVLLAMKRALDEAMVRQDLSNASLAKRLGMVEGTVRRLRDPSHRSHAGSLEAVLNELGIDVTVSFHDWPRKKR